MGATVVFGDFEWDADKADRNVAKHGVSFEEAATVLLADSAVETPDAIHAGRFVTIGFSAAARVLTVVSADVVGGRIRIISAWRATAEERRRYQER